AARAASPGRSRPGRRRAQWGRADRRRRNGAVVVGVNGTEGPSRTPRLAQFTVGGWVGLASALFAAIAVVALVGGLIAITNLSSARDRVVDAVDPASLSAATLPGSYLHQETGVRGYALTA